MGATGPEVNGAKRALRVGVDATAWANRRGFGRFARGMLSRLVELDGEVEYVFYVDAPGAAAGALPPRAEVRRVSLARPPGLAEDGAGRTVADVLRLSAAARADRLDAFLFPSYHTYFPVLGVPSVVGVHDTTPQDLPDLLLRNRRAAVLFRLKARVALRQARIVFTVSEASRRAVGRCFGIDTGSIAVVGCAPDAVFRPRSDAEVASARDALGLDSRDPLFVYAAGINPHKNVETLVDAFARVRPNG
ncbi:MAG: hypothetical protein QOE36_1433, partial [Gaiellaceae bacterium]|nr:hypothetical protein [Gaiellaceae bacterium]